MALASAAAAQTVNLAAGRDNTLYESTTGAFSNGAGEFLFSGRTTQKSDSLRRALLAFDVAGTIPPGSTITSAQLTLTVSMTISGPRKVELRRVLANWGEGASDALFGEGAGASAAAGDATWIHTFFSGTLWGAAGGDFSPNASAASMVSAPGVYSWGSTPEMVTDVQGWLDDPGSDFGWLLLGDEATPGSAKRFDSRENATAPSRPRLTVVYQAAEEPPVTAIPALAPLGMGLLALALAAAGAVALRRF